MDNSLIKNEILYWDEYFSNLKVVDERLLEIAFFKIFVKFELFLSNIFVEYSIGNPSSVGYVAERILQFVDKKHLDGVLKASGGSYIDYVKGSQKFSNLIFEDKKNPFSLVFSDSNYASLFNEMVIIRNYIAHESEKAKFDYTKTIVGQRVYFEPHIHLKRLKKDINKSYYTFYIEKILEMSEILIDPNDYLGNL